MPEPTNRPTKPKKASPLRPFYRLWGYALLVLKRMRFQPGLALLSLLSIVLALGLVTNTSFFSSAVDREILTQELQAFSEQTGRPAFSTSLGYIPASTAPVSLETAEKFSSQIEAILTSKIGLPVRHLGLTVSGGGMLLQPGPGNTLYTQETGYLENVEPVYIAGVASHIQVVDGQPYTDEGTSSGDVLDVWMHENLSQKLGVKVGEEFLIGANLSSPQVTVRLAGFWQSSGPDNEFWFNDPDSSLVNSLLVTRQDFIHYLQPVIPSQTRGLNWYIILDESKVNPGSSQKYLDGFKQSAAAIDRVLPGARLNTPPLDPLEKFTTTSNALTVLLLGYNLPALIILLYFLGLASTIVVRWQRRETTLLVSRGMTVAGVLNHVLVEELLLFIIGYPLGIAFGMGIARLMGYTASFLSFTPRPPLPVSLGDMSIPLTLLALSVALLSRLLPSLQAARQSKVVEEREWARSTRGPFWYRYYLDLLLVLPTYYAYTQMARQGSLAQLVSTKPEDLFRDPLLVLVPALFIVTGSLVIMRLFALVMYLVDVLAALTPWLVIHLALRQISRQSHDYLQPLLLVIISLALGVYTLSMAASLDQWLVDRLYYQDGADLTFTPATLSGDDSTDFSWVPPPAEFSAVPGVEKATRVATLSMQIELNPDQTVRGHFMAIDRLDFPTAAWFRSDFADESLGALMNRLALTPDGVLVPSDALEQSGLEVGDQFAADVIIQYGLQSSTNFTIVGTYDYFPTVYPEDGVTVIGNLDNLVDLFGFTVPFQMWLKTQPGVDEQNLLDDIARQADLTPQKVADTRGEITTQRGKTERVGIFGTLSMGFLATALMAIFGLLLYSYASLRERVYHLAMLLAMGVSRAQIISQVIMEYAFLAIFGVSAGALIGILASELFVPFFRYSNDKGVVPLPPLIPIIAWPQVWNLTIVFTAITVVAENVTITLSIRQQLAQLLK
jgi:putative ABC transport system permease protein